MDYPIKPSNIDGDVYLGCIESASNLQTLQSLRIKHIITLDIRPVDHCLKDMNYLFIKANDYAFEDLLSRFEECYQFIMNGISKGDKVLVHCVAGMSRSATIVISYLMIRNSMTFKDAMALVVKKRDIVSPNNGFRGQLILFDQMNRKLDAMNGEYRQFLLNHMRHKMLSSRPWINPIKALQSTDSQLNSQSNSQPISDPLTQYFNKLRNFMPKNQLNQKQEQIYKCKKCRLYLFNEINVTKNVTENSCNTTVCDSIFIEPTNWMSPYVSNQEMGLINCPNCFIKIGNFDWNHFTCDCNSHKALNCLIFKIDSKKVDSPLFRL